MSRNVFSKKRIFVTSLIIFFWITMTSLLVWREYFSHVPVVKEGYKNALKELASKEKVEDRKKHSKMNIFYEGRSQVAIGSITSIIDATGGQFEVSNQIKFEIAPKDQVKIKHLNKILQLPGLSTKNLKAGIQTKAIIGADYQIKKLNFRMKSNIFNIACEGEVSNGKLALNMLQNGKKVQKELNFPVGTMANSGFEPITVPKNLRKGQKFRMRWFDPITQKYKIANSRVTGKEDFDWSQKKVPVHVVQTTSDGLMFTSWVNEQGEVLQYQVGSFLFIKAPIVSREKATSKTTKEEKQ